MANFVTNDYKLDITPQGSYPVVYMSQFEDGRQIRFRIMNKGMSYTIPVGVSAFISGLKSNGGYYEHTCEIDTTRKYITAPVEADMTDVNGRGVANITLTNGDGEKVISAKFITHTQETVSDDGIEVPTEAETVFQQLLDEIRTAATTIDADIEALQNMVASLAEDTSDAIDIIDAKVDTVDARMDNLVADVHGAEIVTIWSGNMSTDGGTYALSQSVANFDFIDIYYDNANTGVADYLRIPASKTSAAVYIPFFDVSESLNKPLEIGKVALTFSGASVTVAAAKQWWWDGTNEDNATILNAQVSFPVRIDGVKSSASVNAELADVRVGADGTTYNTAGTAVRGQIEPLNDQVGHVAFSVIQNSGINASGVISSVTNSQRTNYIHVSEGEKLYFTNAGSKAEYNAFYDSSKTFISRFDINASTDASPYAEITVPENAVYMIISARNNNPLSSVWRIAKIVDNTLKLKGRSADSAAVGAAIETINNNTTKIETNIKDLDSGIAVINADWANGTIEAQTGNYITSNANRIATVDKVTADKDYVLTIANGFRIYGYYFDNEGEISTKTGWTTGALTIPAGTIFRATIARVTEISGEIADIETFLYSVTMPTQIQTKINGLDARVTALENGEIPSYYDDYLAAKIQTIEELDCTIGNHGDSFVFITDTHMPRNAGHSPALIKHILKNTSVKKVFNGGDTIDDNSTWIAAVETLRAWRNSMNDLTEYRLIGNHDLNKVNQSVTEAYLDNDDFYGTMQKPFENAVVFNGGLYFYVDNTAQKIRYICVDINFPSGGGENTWLQSRLTELEAGWTALVISHYLWGGSPSSGISTDGTRIIGAINNVYSQLQCNVIGILAGHTHVDKSDTESTNGYLLIATTTDAYGANQDAQVTRTVNTVSEQAFDIVHIDTTARKVYMTRIGGGSDREINY